MALLERIHIYLSTYRSVRHNIFIGNIGYIHKIVATIIIISGLCYVYNNNLYLSSTPVNGEVIIQPSYLEKEFNFPSCPKFTLTDDCTKYINTYNKNLTCINKVSLENFFPSGHSRTHIEMTTSILDARDGNKIIAAVENNNIIFKIWFYDKYHNVTLTFLNKDNNKIETLYQNNSYFRIIPNLLLKILNINSIDNINENSYNNCSYRINGITIIININCRNKWPQSLECYAKVYEINMIETMLEYTKIIINDTIHYKRYFGIKIMFDKITGINYHVSLTSLIIMIALLFKFLEYVYIIIHIIIKYSLLLWVYYYNRKHHVSIYDGIYANHINSMSNQLSNEYTCHYVDKRISIDEYENLKELDI